MTFSELTFSELSFADSESSFSALLFDVLIGLNTFLDSEEYSKIVNIRIF